jgi:hypothetical protein
VNRAVRSLVASPRGVQLAAVVARRWSAPARFLIGVAGDIDLARRAGPPAGSPPRTPPPHRASVRDGGPGPARWGARHRDTENIWISP